MDEYSIDEGRNMVIAARKAISEYVGSARFDRGKVIRHFRNFENRHGVFVRIEHWPTRTPRGSMGFAHPKGNLGTLLLEAAVAATEDKEFVPVSHRELEHIVIEVDLIFGLKPVTGSENAKLRKIKPGRDGISVVYGFHRGMVLPIIAAENEWGKEEMLNKACINAGLHANAWKRGDVQLHSFTTQVFRELTPEGPIEEIMFG